jgi:carbon-monoxide dehydrogenase small subunit
MAQKTLVSFTLNGKEVDVAVEARELLIHTLRERLLHTGPHIGCETSHCGACTVDLDGMSVKSCTMLTVQCQGAAMTTIEGLERNGALHALQQAFHEQHGLQCGYCTPGMIMSAIDIVHRHGGQLDEETVRAELEGNICRCTGYHNIVKSVLDAAGRMKVAQAAE